VSANGGEDNLKPEKKGKVVWGEHAGIPIGGVTGKFNLEQKKLRKRGIC